MRFSKVQTARVKRSRDEVVLASRAYLAKSVGLRMLGLMGMERLGKDEGVWLEPCNSIHTFFMRFPIDALFLDRQGKVLRVFRGLKPWRITLPVFGARSVLELAAGGAGDTKEGDYLSCLS